jgi:hypothetical protein
MSRPFPGFPALVAFNLPFFLEGLFMLVGRALITNETCAKYEGRKEVFCSTRKLGNLFHGCSHKFLQQSLQQVTLPVAKCYQADYNAGM